MIKPTPPAIDIIYIPCSDGEDSNVWADFAAFEKPDGTSVCLIKSQEKKDREK